MIRKITNNDFDFIYGLYMHPDINPYLLYEMMDAESFRPIFNELLSQNILFIYGENNNDIGMFKLMRLTHRTAHIAFLGSVAIHPSFAGKGFGKKMLQEIIELGKEMKLLRIELSTAFNNDKAIKLYEKIGFEKEGTLRKYTHMKSDNIFIDEIMMSYLY